MMDKVVFNSLAEGIHAQIFGVHSLGDPQLSHAALADGGCIHEAAHALIRALPNVVTTDEALALVDEAVDFCGTAHPTTADHGGKVDVGDYDLIEAGVQAAIDAGLAVDGERGVAAARVAARHVVTAFRQHSVGGGWTMKDAVERLEKDLKRPGGLGPQIVSGAEAVVEKADLRAVLDALAPDVGESEAVVEAVARAIEGPHLPVPVGSKFSLEHLRDIRWKRLGEQEQGERLSQARAAITALRQRSAGGMDNE